MEIEKSKDFKKIKIEIEMLVENIVLTRQSIKFMWTYERRVDLRGYEGVTCSNPYYNGTN